MPYVNVPNDLSKIKTKMAFNLTKRQLVCFGSAGAVGIPAYLLTRGTLGNTGAMFLMLGIMLPAFLLAMYEKDGLPFEKVVRNIIRAKFLRPGIRAYRTENIRSLRDCKSARNSAASLLNVIRSGGRMSGS
ncbi:PrgI family protein [Faecalibacterium prausnitzii]|uniref:PrgI family protein n=1 Tax=Faecalibacterium prausnitzii TaxID=853 RepID=UPI003F1DF71A